MRKRSVDVVDDAWFRQQELRIVYQSMRSEAGSCSRGAAGLSQPDRDKIAPCVSSQPHHSAMHQSTRLIQAHASNIIA